jgi:hypothetical protein
MFEIKPLNVTKELLLNKFSEEQFMTFYLGIVPSPGLFLSPLREDKKPTCAFYRDKKNNLIFKDLRGDFHGDFIEVVKYKFNVGYHDALTIIANDFGIINTGKKNEALCEYDGSTVDTKEISIIECKIKEFTDKELKWWKDFGITAEILSHFNVYSIDSVFLNGNYYCSSTKNSPIYGYYFGIIDGIERWKIYFPFKTNHRFLLNTSILQGIKQVKKHQEYILVTKSLKDVMTAYSLGITAVAPQAESIVLKQKEIEYLSKKCNFLVTNGDWDYAGKLFMIKSRKLYPTICLSIKNKEKYGKDISDFHKKFGKEKTLKLKEYLVTLNGKNKFKYQFSYCKTDNVKLFNFNK